MTELIVASVNVNGIRAAVRRGMGPWLAARSPDVLCLQEVRAPDAEVEQALGDGWHIVHAEAADKGRAGVAVASRAEPAAVRIGLAATPAATGTTAPGTAATGTTGTAGTASDGPPADTPVGDHGEFLHSGRWVEMDLALESGDLTIVSVYVFTGEAETERQEQKYRFLDLARARLNELAATRHVLICGDFNIAHREEDLRNWKGNLKKSGFLVPERSWLDALFDEDGMVDVVRRLAGDGPGPYSWWSWRGKAFDTDTGWRIDYQIASRELAATAVKAEIDRAPTYAERWSDHAPVVVTYDL